MVEYKNKCSPLGMWNRIESPEVNQQIDERFIHNRCYIESRAKKVSSTNDAWKTGYHL